MAKYVIIGGGAAGFAAAKAIRQRDDSGSIQVYTQEPYLPYIRPALTQVLAGKISIDGIYQAKAQFYQDSSIGVQTGASVIGIDAGARLLALDDGTSQPYEQLLIATGATSFNPIKRSGDAMPMFTLRTFDDAQALMRACTGKHLLLVGGGILGLEAALSILPLCEKITILERAERLLPQADEQTSSRILDGLRAKGIEVALGITAQELTREGALLTDGSTKKADLALVSIGVRSNLELAKSIGLAVERGIVVDEFMRTSVPRVFAAGDCAQVFGAVAGLWMPSVRMGQAAGAAMTGDLSAPYVPEAQKMDLHKVMAKL